MRLHRIHPFIVPNVPVKQATRQISPIEPILQQPIKAQHQGHPQTEPLCVPVRPNT